MSLCRDGSKPVFCKSLEQLQKKPENSYNVATNLWELGKREVVAAKRKSTVLFTLENTWEGQNS